MGPEVSHKMQINPSETKKDNHNSYSWGNREEEKFRKLWPEVIFLVIFLFLVYSIHIIANRVPLTFKNTIDTDVEWYLFATYQKNLPLNHFPLWMTGLSAGMPFLGFSHTSAIYPFSFLYKIFPFAAGFFIRIVAHQFIIGIGVLLLLNFLGLSRPARLVGALSAMVGGWINYAMYVDPTLNSTAWVPIFFYFCLRVCKHGRLRDGLAIPPIIFLQITGGDMESLVYEYAGIALFLLLLGPQVTGKPHWKNFARLSLWGALGMIMVMIQYLPAQEFISQSVRALGTAREFLTQLSQLKEASPKYLLTILPLKGFAGNRGYQGFVVLFFGVYAIIKMRDRNLTALTILAIIIILHPLLLYRVPPYLEFFYHLPLFSKFRTPQRFFNVAQLFILIISGIGIDYAIRNENIRGFLRLFLAAGILFGLLAGFTSGIWTLLPWSALCLFLLLIAGKRIISPKTGAAILVITVLFDIGAIFLIRTPRSGYNIFDYDPVYTSFFKGRIQIGRSATLLNSFFEDKLVLPRQNGILFGTDAIDLWPSVPLLRYATFLTTIRPDALEVINGKLKSSNAHFKFKEPALINLGSFHLLDLLNVRYFAVKGINIKMASPYSLLKELPQDIKKQGAPQKTPRLIYVNSGGVDTPTLELKKDWTFEWRISVSQGDTLLYNLGSNGPSGTMRIEISTPTTAPELINESSSGPVTGGNWVYSPSQTVNLNPWAGQLVIIRVSIQIENNLSGAFEVQGLEITNPNKPLQRIRNGKTEIYLNKEAMNRSYIVHKATIFSNDEQMLSYMADRNKFKIKNEILLNTKQAKELTENNGLNLPPSSSEQAQLMIYQQDRIVEKTNLDTPGFVALTDTYYPGWRCFADGKEAKILQSNYTFRAVKLPAGSHVLEWLYEPESFRIGLWMSISSAFLWIVVSLLHIKGRGNS